MDKIQFNFWYTRLKPYSIPGSNYSTVDLECVFELGFQVLSSLVVLKGCEAGLDETGKADSLNILGPADWCLQWEGRSVPYCYANIR